MLDVVLIVAHSAIVSSNASPVRVVQRFVHKLVARVGISFIHPCWNFRLRIFRLAASSLWVKADPTVDYSPVLVSVGGFEATVRIALDVADPLGFALRVCAFL
jgi:hypothetical protein